MLQSISVLEPNFRGMSSILSPRSTSPANQPSFHDASKNAPDALQNATGELDDNYLSTMNTWPLDSIFNDFENIDWVNGLLLRDDKADLNSLECRRQLYALEVPAARTSNIRI